MTIFSAVKKAIATDPEAILRKLNVQVKKHVHGEWTQCKCPICDDESGSASVTPVGFLRCHQCSAKMDVFEWLSHRDGGSQLDACKRLAAELGVEAQPYKRAKRSRGLASWMNDDLL